jgi:hypothetical protein
LGGAGPRVILPSGTGTVVMYAPGVGFAPPTPWEVNADGHWETHYGHYGSPLKEIQLHDD